MCYIFYFWPGIETVAQLASSKSEQIENILYSAEPFKSKKNNEANGEDNKKVLKQHAYWLEFSKWPNFSSSRKSLVLISKMKFKLDKWLFHFNDLSLP